MHTASLRYASVAALAASFTLAGCPVDSGLIDRLDTVDAGEDNGGINTVPLCADIDSAFSITEEGIYMIDTRTFETSAVQSDICDESDQDGHPAFFQLVANGGDRWHFHLARVTVAGDDNASDADPFMGVFDSCSDRSCEYAQNLCTGTDDEHFAIDVNGSGNQTLNMVLGDAAGGSDAVGLFRLSAFQFRCGDGDQEHGEACDPSDENSSFDETTCHPALCLRFLRDGQTEFEINDTRPEANYLVFNDAEPTATNITSGELSISGFVEENSCYPDYFRLEPAAGTTLRVTTLAPGGGPCDEDTVVAHQLFVEDNAGGSTQGITPVGDCSEVELDITQAGTRYIRVARAPSANLDSGDVAYRLNIEISSN